MRRIYVALVGTVLAAMIALPAGATTATSTSTDLMVVRVKVTDITTQSTTVAHPGDKVRFVVVMKNKGVDTAANMTSIGDLNASCMASPYFTGTTAGSCVWQNVPAGAKGNSMKLKVAAPASGTVSSTFCVSIENSPGQTDPNSANNCGTGSIPVG